jgi:hypothetical protein
VQVQPHEPVGEVDAREPGDAVEAALAGTATGPLGPTWRSAHSRRSGLTWRQV